MMRFLTCFTFVLAACVGTIEDMEPVDPVDPQDPMDPTDPPPDPTDPPPPPAELRYATDIAPKLAFCAGCHANAAPEGKYRTDSYAALLGIGKDTIPNVIASDANSLLVQYLAPAPGKNHKGANEAVPGIGALVRDWVVTAGAPE